MASPNKTTQDFTNLESEKEKEVAEASDLNYDEILVEHLGQLGRYQLRSFIILGFPLLFSSIIVMSYSFTGGVPDYRCFVDGCENNTDFYPNWLNNTIPWDDEGFSRCYVYNRTFTNTDECLRSSDDENQLKKCDKWVYDTSTFSSTIFTDFDLTCDDEWWQPIPSMAYMAGMLFGAITIGTLSDSIGRRKAFLVNAIMMAFVVTGTAFSPDVITFTVLRFLSGIGGTANFDVVFVWGVEFVGPKYRLMCGFIYQSVFTLGCILVGVVAYFVRDWRTLQLIIGVPIFAFISIFWIVPESTLWLISKKRYQEAVHLIMKAAKVNGKTLPAELLVYPNQNLNKSDSLENNEKSSHRKENLLDIFLSMIMLKRLFITAIAWVAINMGYYGITYSANNLSGDFYLNYQLVMLVEIPAYIVGKYFVDYFGRRTGLTCGLLAGGLACLATGLIPEDPAYVRVICSLIGKFFITSVFGVIYSYTVELFPTSTRSAAVGFCSTSARIGGILAPILAEAGRRVNPSLPYIIFACVNIFVGILCLLLPETSGTTLPGTVAEAIELERQSTSCFSCCNKKKSTDSTNSLQLKSDNSSKSTDAESQRY